MTAVSSRGARREATQALPCVALLALLCIGCADDPLSVDGRSALRDVLTPAAVESLDGNGRFILDTVPGAGEIGAGQAKAYALAWWDVQGNGFRSVVEHDRGAPVNMQALTVCPRAYYVASAYTSVPADTPESLRKEVGAHWIVGFCNGPVQEVVIFVSARATDVRLATANTPFEAGRNNFMPAGVPVGVTMPMMPETAAVLVAERTSTRITAVPRLIMRAWPSGATAAVWHVDLESPLIRPAPGDGPNQLVQTLVAGNENGWFAPWVGIGAPDTSLVDEVRIAWPGQSVSTYRFTRRADVARVVETLSRQAGE